MNNQQKTVIDIKCPECNRYLMSVASEMAVLKHKCNSCKNCIETQIEDSTLIINAIDFKRNNLKILGRNERKSKV